MPSIAPSTDRSPAAPAAAPALPRTCRRDRASFGSAFAASCQRASTRRCVPSASAWSRDRRRRRAPDSGRSSDSRASPVTSALDIHADAGDEMTGELARRRHRHLLAEDRTAGEFEPVPCARRAQSRPPQDQRRKIRIAREMRADRGDIGIEIEQPPKPRDDGEQRAHFGKTDRRDEMISAWRDLDAAVCAADLDACACSVRYRQARRPRWRDSRGTPGSRPNRRARDSRA